MVTQPNKAEIEKLIQKLEQAYICCWSCGNLYGVYSVGCSSVWIAKCDICENTGPVTETRDFGYLVAGHRRLTLQIQANQNLK